MYNKGKKWVRSSSFVDAVESQELLHFFSSWQAQIDGIFLLLSREEVLEFAAFFFGGSNSRSRFLRFAFR